MTIFIIDDELLFSRNLKTQLEEVEGNDVYCFQFLSDSLPELYRKPDVIIVNHIVNGLQSIKFIDIFNKRIPNSTIFYITSIEKVEILATAKQLGIAHFFLKDEFLGQNIKKALEGRTALPTKQNKGILKLIREKLQKNTPPVIFMLDDDKLFSAFIRNKMSKYGSIKLSIFEHPSELYEAAHEQPDLLFLDYHLTETTGDKVFKKFKPLSPKTKVVMFSSQQDLQTAIRLFDAGIVDYIVKNNQWEKNVQHVLEKQLNLKLERPKINVS